MNINVDFEDFLLSEDRLNNARLKTETVSELFDINVLKRKLIEEFLAAFEWIFSGQEDQFKDTEILINVINSSHEDLRVIAAYELDKSSIKDKSYYFVFYNDSLISALLHGQGDEEWLKTIWVHELTHMMDSTELFYFIKRRREYEKKQGTRQDDSTAGKGAFWYLLNYIHHLRAEGSAVLIEFIFNEKLRNFPSEDIAYQILQRNIGEITKIAKQSSIANLFDQTEFISITNERINPSSYYIGPWIVINGLINSMPEQATLFSKAKRALERKEEVFLNADEKRQLLRAVKRFDLLSFVKSLQCEDLIYRSIYEITSAEFDNYTELTNLFDVLKKISDTKDPRIFSYLMSEVIGYPFKMTEISGMHQLFINREFPTDFIELESLLYEKAVSGSDIAIWALTYLYDDKDLLDDEIAYLGFYDDYLILALARELIV